MEASIVFKIIAIQPRQAPASVPTTGILVAKSPAILVTVAAVFSDDDSFLASGSTVAYDELPQPI